MPRCLAQVPPSFLRHDSSVSHPANPSALQPHLLLHYYELRQYHVVMVACYTGARLTVFIIDLVLTHNALAR